LVSILALNPIYRVRTKIEANIIDEEMQF